MSVCLSDLNLEAFVGGSASEQEMSAWSVHLETCDTCTARLARKQNALSAATSASVVTPPEAMMLQLTAAQSSSIAGTLVPAIMPSVAVSV